MVLLLSFDLRGVYVRVVSVNCCRTLQFISASASVVLAMPRAAKLTEPLLQLPKLAHLLVMLLVPSKAFYSNQSYFIYFLVAHQYPHGTDSQRGLSYILKVANAGNFILHLSLVLKFRLVIRLTISTSCIWPA